MLNFVLLHVIHCLDICFYDEFEFNHKILDISIICLLFWNLVNIFAIFLSKHELDESLNFLLDLYNLIENGGIRQIKPDALE